MHKKIICAMLLLSLIGILIKSPLIDLSIAKLPYDDIRHIFYGEVSLWCKVIYLAVPWLTFLVVVTPLLWFLKASYAKDKKQLVKAKRACIIILLSLILGPGLVVNMIFKDHWGRARPYQVLRDGKTFSPVWQPDFSQRKDNSFPSGHASIGFFMGIPLLALNRRKLALMVSMVGGAIIGGVRILQGGHYFSDVIFAGFFVWLIALIIIYFTDKWYKKVNSE